MNTIDYIKRIRNPKKQAYALNYWTWLRKEYVVDTEPQARNYGLSFMAAQAVRQNISQLNQFVG